MNKTIIVKVDSCNFWWGVLGFCGKVYWEDVSLSFDNGDRIGRVCLNSKQYIRATIEELEDDPEESDYVDKMKLFLSDTRFQYWYFYDDIDDIELYEVPYDAPVNDDGLKPCFTDIWHPDEGIGLESVISGVKDFAKRHLGMDDCNVNVVNDISIEELTEEFHKFQEMFSGENPVNVSFSDEVVDKMMELTGKSRDEVLGKLHDAV